MKLFAKRKFIYLGLVSFLFLSCESVYLDMNDIHCTIDKKTYEKDENVTLTCYESFDDRNDVGSLRLDFVVYRLSNNENDNLTFQNVNISFSEDSEIQFSSSEELYRVNIKEKEEMSTFKKVIIFRIHNSGKYELHIAINGSTDNHPYGGIRRFTFPITITE